MCPQSQPSTDSTCDLVLCLDLGWLVSLTQDRVPDVPSVLTDLSLLPQEPRPHGSLGLLHPRSRLQLSLGHLPPTPPDPLARSLGLDFQPVGAPSGTWTNKHTSLPNLLRSCGSLVRWVQGWKEAHDCDLTLVSSSREHFCWEASVLVTQSCPTL